MLKTRVFHFLKKPYNSERAAKKDTQNPKKHNKKKSTDRIQTKSQFSKNRKSLIRKTQTEKNENWVEIPKGVKNHNFFFKEKSLKFQENLAPENLTIIGLKPKGLSRKTKIKKKVFES